jgi:hypothetical protein
MTTVLLATHGGGLGLNSSRPGDDAVGAPCETFIACSYQNLGIVPTLINHRQRSLSQDFSVSVANRPYLNIF